MVLKLYHVGFLEIKKPDIRFGRKNADFGQGFYLSPDLSFSRRWARAEKGKETYLNAYELDTEGLRVKEFKRDSEWFSYISKNRNNEPDALIDFDVIKGPIANDIIYDLLGVTTSGFLDDLTAIKILSMGPEYTQVVIKTDKANSSLHFISSEVLDPKEMEINGKEVEREEEEFQKAVSEILLE